MPRPYKARWGVKNYKRKTPHFTPDSFNEVHECPHCGGKHFECSKQLSIRHGYYRVYGYLCKRIIWRIRCGNKKCQTPIGVILKPEYWDSAI